MSVTQTENIELSYFNGPDQEREEHTTGAAFTDQDDVPLSAIEAIPDGGYGWAVVFACAVITFTINGWSGSWGVVQNAIFQEKSVGTETKSKSITSLPFVGSLGIALTVGLSLGAVRLSQIIGARNSMSLGVVLMGVGIFLSGFTVNHVAGLFFTAGTCAGLGSCITYTTSNSLPVQWFSGKLGLANGLVKLGGGLGGTVMAIVFQALIDRIGIPWALRIVGFVAVVTGLPAALMIREHAPSRRSAFVDLTLFRSFPFSCLFLAGATGTFALYVPPYFLPLFATSIGLSSSTGAGLVAAFNGCGAIGRLGAGYLCDKLGSMNMLLLTMLVNTLSTLAIWPLSSKLGPLILFAVLNGMSNGAFFVAMPTAVGRMTVTGQAPVGMGMAVSGWTGGYLMGGPIAGILIAATGAEQAHNIAAYRPAIFYAGGVTVAATLFVLAARFKMDRKLIEKM